MVKSHGQEHCSWFRFVLRFYAYPDPIKVNVYRYPSQDAFSLTRAKKIFNFFLSKIHFMDFQAEKQASQGVIGLQYTKFVLFSSLPWVWYHCGSSGRFSPTRYPVVRKRQNNAYRVLCIIYLYVCSALLSNCNVLYQMRLWLPVLTFSGKCKLATFRQRRFRSSK